MLIATLEVDFYSLAELMEPKRLFHRIVSRLFHYALEHMDGPQFYLHSCCTMSSVLALLEELQNEEPRSKEQRVELDS